MALYSVAANLLWWKVVKMDEIARFSFAGVYRIKALFGIILIDKKIKQNGLEHSLEEIPLLQVHLHWSESSR